MALIIGNTRAAVFDQAGGHFALRFQVKTNGSFIRGEFHRIGEQIIKNRLQLFPVSEHDSGYQFHFELDVSGKNRVVLISRYFLDEFLQIDRYLFNRDIFRPGHIEIKDLFDKDLEF